MMYLFILLGFILLLGGAEFLVKGAVGLARRLGISALVIGMTVVALGTSAPEFVVSLNAAFEGVSGIATGNIIGSNIANILLILGISALIAPIVSDPESVRRDGIILLAATALFIILSLSGSLDTLAGILLFGSFIAFLGYSYWRERKGTDEEAAALHAQEAEEVEAPSNLWVSLAMTVGGMAAVVYGSELLVDNGTKVARLYGVSEEVIGLTMIAIGTSLPELAASGMAALRGHTDVALGNVIGSNLFNILGVMGAVSLIQPLEVSAQLIQFDLWVMLAATLVMLPFIMSRLTLTRGVGLSFFVIYCGYIAVQAVGVDTLLG